MPSDGATVSDVLYYVHGTDGVLDTSGSFSNSRALVIGDGPLRMADSYQDVSRDFLGYLDDVRLYDTALSQSGAQAFVCSLGSSNGSHP